jgi:threonine dehydrogenase-like Zn-dependent dehydrogenase
MLGGFDLIYDCVGYNNIVHDALRWLKAHGTYVMIGNQLSPITFDQTPLWNQELTMLGVNSHGMENYKGRTLSSFDLAVEMIADKRISLDGFITHRFKLNDYQAAFRLALDKPGHVIKVIFEIG